MHISQLGMTNNFVRVRADLLLATIVCEFIDNDDQSNNLKSCSIAYGPVENCNRLQLPINHSHIMLGNTTAASDSVVINLPVLSESIGKEYCYIVTASNGTFTAFVKGTFSTGIKCNLQQIIHYNYHDIPVLVFAWY